MQSDFTILISNILVALVSGPLGAWISSRLLRSRYEIELQDLRAQLARRRAESETAELDNVRQASDILMENIVAPLRAELKSLRRDVSKFRKAVEQIPSCPMSDACPVSRQLHDEQKGADEPDDADGREKSRRRGTTK